MSNTAALTGNHRKTRQRGAAMVLVMVFSLLALMTLAYCFERTRQLFAFEERSLRLAASDSGVERALGIGIARLRSGTPADSTFSCSVKLRDSAGHGIESYDVIYTEVMSGRWSVEAVPSSIDIDECPDLFTASCPVAP